MHVLARCLASWSPPGAAYGAARSAGWALGLMLGLLTVHPVAAQVTLAWNPSPSAGVEGYRVHYGTQTHIYTASLDAGLVTTATVTGLSNDQTYYFVVVAYDHTDGTESAVSNEVSATLASGQVQALVAAYGFNEATGPTTADASGHAYMGSLMHGVAWTRGQYGTGLSFDGATAFVALPTSLDIPTLPFTLEAWVKPTDYAFWRNIFSKRTSYDATAMRVDWLLDIGTGQVRLTQAASDLIFTFAPPLNTWTHLAVVAQTTGTQLYVNGVLSQTMGVFTLGSSASAPVSLGASQQGTDDWFKGAIDEVRLYNRALSPSEIQADMRTPIP